MSSAWLLNVDDNRDDALLLRHACKKAGVRFELTTASHGAEAMEMLWQARTQDGRLPSLILLDLSMPVMTGFEVLEALRREPTTRGLTVAVFTSSENECDVAAAYGRGADYYLSKPSDVKQLIALMRGIDEAAAASQDHPWACLRTFPTYKVHKQGQ